jgi:hypothetical protein
MSPPKRVVVPSVGSGIRCLLCAMHDDALLVAGGRPVSAERTFAFAMFVRSASAH